MSVLEILTIPDKRLKCKSSEVKFFDNNLKIIIEDMFDTLKDSGNGIKEGGQEAMKCFTNVKTFSLPWTN